MLFLVFFVQNVPGWMMGERLHDKERGWFPSRVIEEIKSKEARVQNLREAFRVQQTHKGEGGTQSEPRTGLRAVRPFPKSSNFTSLFKHRGGDNN